MPLILSDATKAKITRVLSFASYWKGVPVTGVTLETAERMEHCHDWKVFVTVHYRTPVYGRTTTRDIVSLDALLAPGFMAKQLPIFHA